MCQMTYQILHAIIAISFMSYILKHKGPKLFISTLLLQPQFRSTSWQSQVTSKKPHSNRQNLLSFNGQVENVALSFNSKTQFLVTVENSEIQLTCSLAWLEAIDVFSLSIAKPLEQRSQQTQFYLEQRLGKSASWYLHFISMMTTSCFWNQN